MKTSTLTLRSLLATLALGLAAPFALHAAPDVAPVATAPVLRSGDLVAVCGDSITEQKLYSLYIQQYLMLCQPAENLISMQFGWSGERAPGFVGRLDNDVLTFKPTVATTCYGMNDGGYTAVTPAIVDTYRKAMIEAVRKLKVGGVRSIIVGSPGVVDPKGFKRPSADAATYNANLAALRDAAREVAASENVLFADVHAVMMDAMLKAKAARGDDYSVAPDGVHPTPNGQLAMAYAFIKALGVDGAIGQLTIDYTGNRAIGTAGHKVTGYKDGVLSVESTRYPFCFDGAPEGNGTLAMSQFLPFNQDLNRYLLVVQKAPARVRVTWGETSKEFTAAQLAAGINLAAEFPANPFSAPFAQASKAFAAQQAFETAGIKNMLNALPRWSAGLPEAKDHIDAIRALIVKKTEDSRDASRAAVVPVAHQLKIEAL